MTLIQELEFALRTHDGSCRDINFKAPTWQGATSLVKWFCQNYTILSAITAQGTDVKSSLANCESYELSGPLSDEYINIVVENPEALITQMQVYIGNEKDGAPFIELTFFPEALNAEFSWSIFIYFVEEMKQRLQSRQYFVRYENASWRFTTSGSNSGVICKSEDAVGVDY